MVKTACRSGFKAQVMVHSPVRKKRLVVDRDLRKYLTAGHLAEASVDRRGMGFIGRM